jgi:hypothetical protein
LRRGRTETGCSGMRCWRRPTFGCYFSHGRDAHTPPPAAFVYTRCWRMKEFRRTHRTSTRRRRFLRRRHGWSAYSHSRGAAPTLASSASPPGAWTQRRSRTRTTCTSWNRKNLRRWLTWRHRRRLSCRHTSIRWPTPCLFT